MKEFDWDYVYCYPDSDILINKFGIKDSVTLNNIERDLTAINVNSILKTPVKGVFDLKHLQQIHKKLFEDIYDWAGKLRTVNISKGYMFYRFDYLESAVNELFSKLKNEHYLIGYSTDEVTKRLAYYMGEINVIHPFRDGNGRTQRVFIEYLAKAAGYDVDFSTVTQDEMISASISSFDCDYVPMEQMFSRITKPVSFVEQFQFVKKIAPIKSDLESTFIQYGCVGGFVTKDQLQQLKESKVPFIAKRSKEGTIIMASIKDKDIVNLIMQGPPRKNKGQKR